MRLSWTASLVAATLFLSIPLTDVHTQSSKAGWEQYVTPEDAGFSSNALELARRYADSVRSGAVMAAYRGRVVVAWGDVARKLELHSVRKSLVSALFGIAVADRKVDLSRTIADVGLDDQTPLTVGEKSARIRDILAARSGVYLPAAYAGREQDEERPARGSHAPGTFFFYNNWDFNVAGVLYERLVATDLYAAFDQRIAKPLGMEDFVPTDGFRVYEPSGSGFPAHTFRMSTRDLLRFGQLYLQRGRWNGKQVVPAAWVDESTRRVSDLGNGSGYGYLWWTYAAGSLGARYPQLNQYDAFAARGTGGQFILVVPKAELVVVHRGDTDHGREVRGPDVWRIAELILAARTGTAREKPSLAPVQAIPLASQLPAIPSPSYLQLDSRSQDELVGEYENDSKLIARVFRFNDRLFANLPGRGEAELLAFGPLEFTIMPMPGVRVRFERDSTGRVGRVALTLGREQLTATRR